MGRPIDNLRAALHQAAKRARGQADPPTPWVRYEAFEFRGSFFYHNTETGEHTWLEPDRWREPEVSELNE